MTGPVPQAPPPGGHQQGHQGQSPGYSQYPPPERPQSLTRAIQLGIGNMALGLIVPLYSILFNTDEIRQRSNESAESRGLTMPQGSMSNFITAVIVGTVILTLVMALIWGLLVRSMSQGRNGARVTLTILAILWMVLCIPSLFVMSYGGVVTAVLVAIQLVGLVAMVYFMSLKGTKEYLSYMKLVRTSQIPAAR